MIKFIIGLIILMVSFQVNSQQLTTETVVPLSMGMEESSGLMFLNGKLITHNDSGTAAELYEIDTLTGGILRTVVVENVINTDWEDVTVDDDYIYIGDFGNNLGSRTDLSILKISITDYNNTLNDTVTAEIIEFNYANQIDFSPGSFATNFDAESLISYGDSLYVFTKNWGNSKSNYYAISKNAGNYSVLPKGEIDVQGYVTGAVYNSLSNEIILCGYSFTSPFITRLSQVIDDDFESLSFEKFNLSVGSSSIQVEGICAFSDESYYLSSEAYNNKPSELLRLNKANALSLDSKSNLTIDIYPNPFYDNIIIHSEKDVLVELMSNTGQKIGVIEHGKMDLSYLSPGIYILKITEQVTTKIVYKKILKY